MALMVKGRVGLAFHAKHQQLVDRIGIARVQESECFFKMLRIFPRL
jgi:hypothetical protein